MRKVGFGAGSVALLSVLVVLPAGATGSATKGRIAFQATVAGAPQVFTISPDGSGLRQITHLAAPALWGVAWSPDGSALVFSASGKGPDLLYQTGPNGGPIKRISPTCTGSCLGDDSPAFSPSGKTIAFARAFGPIRDNNAAAVGIMTMSATTGDLRQLTQTERPTSTEDHRPDWSPDGKRIAFERLNTTATPTSQGVVAVASADGTNARRLTPIALNADNPKWSRDGKTIIFNSNYEDELGRDANIYSVRADGTGLKQLTHYADGKRQAYLDCWSPDGTQILFHLRGTDPNGPGVNQLFVMNANGTGVHQLTHMPHGTNPSFAAWGTAG